MDDRPPSSPKNSTVTTATHCKHAMILRTGIGTIARSSRPIRSPFRGGDGDFGQISKQRSSSVRCDCRTPFVLILARIHSQHREHSPLVKANRGKDSSSQIQDISN
jgi:hypothetical protein